MMPRIVCAEELDTLGADDPSAMRSRRDLRRVHRVLGSRSIVRRGLEDMFAHRREAAPMRVLELGAGDGSFMLGVARHLTPRWRNVELTLLDRQLLLDNATIAQYAAVGWKAFAWVVDARDWTAGAADPSPADGPGARWDLIVANLFLHHFAVAELNPLLNAAALCTDRFFACEPRRNWFALLGSHLIGAIGVNAVTRGDAVVSVHAGFGGNELTASWPTQGDGWRLSEYPAGPFSHCFRAERIEAG
jgi:hypothetical protein